MYVGHDNGLPAIESLGQRFMSSMFGHSNTVDLTLVLNKDIFYCVTLC